MASSRRLRVWVRFLGMLVAMVFAWVVAVYWLVSRQADQDESRQAEAIVVFAQPNTQGIPRRSIARGSIMPIPCLGKEWLR
jgi:hypothetical protein